jgi:hypothetical protein
MNNVQNCDTFLVVTLLVIIKFRTLNDIMIRKIFSENR